MKRLIVRFVALGSIVGLGGFAIVHMQHSRDRAAAAEADKAAGSTMLGAPTPIPLADDGDAAPAAARRLPGASNANSGRLIAQMQPNAAPDQAGDEAPAAGPDPFRRAASPDRGDQNVQAAAEEPADSQDDRDRNPGADRNRSDDLEARKPAQQPSDDWRYSRPPGQPDEAREPQARDRDTASALVPRKAAVANDPGSADVQTPEKNNFTPVPAAAAADPPGDAFAPPANRDTVSVEGTGRPGGAQLEGSQAPSLTIQKIAPAEIQVGKPATFTIKVRNTGSVTAQGVEIYDEIPQGTQLVSTTPRANRGPAGQLIFDLGVIKPNEEAQAQVQLMPMTEGEIGSVATVHFRAAASVRTVATKPLLTLQVAGPAKAMIGEEVNFKIKISNPGSGAATGVVLSETVPPGLKHSTGSELEFDVGTLKPGESRDLDLVMTAVRPGPVSNVLAARGEAGLHAESQVDVEVLAPGLKVAMNGAKRRYLERNATYNLQVSNPGTAAAKDVELIAVVPKGMKFVQANNSGQYDAATRSVYWRLEELPPRETGAVALTLLPIEPGELKLQIRGKAKQGLADAHEEAISVEGLAAIVFELTDVNDPIEVGGETTYEVRVINQGTKAASNVRVVAILPPEMKPLSADGPSRHVVDGQRVLFDPLAQLAPKADTTYSVKAQGLKAGDMRIRVQVVTDELSAPITKEESTRVYSDE